MAPREAIKATPPKSMVAKGKSSQSTSSPSSTIKKTLYKKSTENNSKNNKTEVSIRQRTISAPKVSTPKAKENKTAPMPSSVTKSAKKPTWKRRPKPAHSGVPVPEKMKQLFQKQLLDLETL